MHSRYVDRLGRSFGPDDLVGTLWYDGTIADCYATGTVAGGAKSRGLGGLVGGIEAGDIFPSLGRMGNCYATGAVTAPTGSSCLGGLLGQGADSDDLIAITQCCFLAPSDGGGPDDGCGIPLTKEQITHQNSFTGWDFRGTWTICEGKSYPRLTWEGPACEP
jgi:hypothetical protein